MEKASKFLPFILGGIVAIVVFFVSRKIRNGNTSTERAAILEKAREAKLAKSILKKSEDEESTTNSGE
jgi:phosphate/sulfate permease